MKLKFNIRREIKIPAVLIAVFGLIAFTERMKGSVSVKNIEIKIDNIHENHFLDEEDILKLMQVNQGNLMGTDIKKLNLKAIEKKIKDDAFVKDAQLYSDVKGNLVVGVELRRPVARMVRNDGPDGYIAEDGTVMPVSDKFTSRVVLISGSFVRQLLLQHNVNETEEGKQLMEMLKMIRKDDFWSAQIAELDINSQARITLYPQVGDEHIEFGKPENLELKFRKLKIFYKEILPKVGWNKYNRVNLEYEGQIVAE
ncbi:MAG: cell division protein FtsQ/DivIB [Bacteroidota bacterium]